MNNQSLVDYLKDCGVCTVCQLRYLKARGTEYKNIKETFERLNVQYEFTESGKHVNKRSRLNICPTCLGLFSTDFQAKLKSSILATNFASYDCESIVVAITMPMLLQIRQLSMWFALLDKFGTAVDTRSAPDVPIKEAVKLILNPIICNQLQKDYNANGIMINITLNHIQESEELACLQKLHKVAFGSNGKRLPEISRGTLEKQYTPTIINGKQFVEFLPIPPTAPNESLSLETISLTGPTVFVAGRYRKITRDLSHTPWVLNGQRVMEDSIEEIINRSITPYFCSDLSKIIFMSSGREDVDVRCLGKGRPFVLEIPNAMHVRLSKCIAHKMEQDVERSGKVSVRDLQIVQREDLVHIKTGEEKKQKFYRALCILREPATVNMLQKLNLFQGFEIQQKTPIRVLHRRPLHTRPRTIYSLKACVARENPCLLVLDIVSQAGTYIKELVHGEFGRTTPSVASIIGKPIDILALDVVGIDLEWPKEVNNRE